jgi:Protein of unknown function (DUF2800)
MDLSGHAIRQAADAEHARFSPSSAERWMTCPGSIALTRDIPNTTSEYAAEGTAAHTLASRALTYDKPAAFFYGQEIEADGRVFVVDDDMANYVQVYLDEVHARTGDGTLMVEQRIQFIEAIGVPGQFGTSDAIILSKDCKRAAVGDLKYGQGVKVYVEENKQLMTYAVGVLETFDMIMSDVEEVDLFVVQPRLDHIDSWTVSVERLRQHAAEMRLAAGAALEGCQALEDTGMIPEVLFKPSDDACFFCPAKATCDALRKHVSALVFDDFETLDDPVKLEVIGAPAVPAGDKLGALYGYLELIEDWCRGVRAEVERQVFAGMTVIGPDGLQMKLVEGKRGNRAWKDEQKAEQILAGLVPPDKLYKPRELVTVSVVDKMFNKKATKAQWDQLQDLITQSKGKAKVVLGSNPAPPYTADADSSEFEDLGHA